MTDFGTQMSCDAKRATAGLRGPLRYACASVRGAVALLLSCVSCAWLIAACSSASVDDARSEQDDAGGPTDGSIETGTRDGSAQGDAARDATGDGSDAGEAGDAADAGDGCFLSTVGVTGECITTSACEAVGNHISTPGYCPGIADIQCCTPTPNVADNPPVPAGWTLMAQSAVTSQMTTWAVEILDDPTTYPMFSTTIQVFGTTTVMARVEWHPPDFQNSTVHRGVTLYVPTDAG